LLLLLPLQATKDQKRRLLQMRLFSYNTSPFSMYDR
jgi:hypothetical protein